jgi:hypothetical protein
MIRALFYAGVVAVLCTLLMGCATERYLEIQCLDRPRAETVEGPVIVNEEDIIYYDARNKLRKVSKETCGIKSVE